jgi:hypothetical protein
MNDPTYVKQEIDANPTWKLAWRLSELDNDDAPIGWGRYITIAHHVRGQIAADVVEAVDKWVRAGGGTYDELEAVVEAALINPKG